MTSFAKIDSLAIKSQISSTKLQTKKGALQSERLHMSNRFSPEKPDQSGGITAGKKVPDQRIQVMNKVQTALAVWEIQ
jgi:hypothetical protein